MTPDDMLAHLAATPKRNRPTELRSDTRMLGVWVRLRRCREFRLDVINRHNLNAVQPSKLDPTDPTHEHAISNAWGHCVQVYLESLNA